MLWLLLACGGDPTPDPDPDEARELPFEHAFSFVVIADPHVSSEGEHADRLRLAVDWVNAEADVRGIDLVIVVGDIGWTEAGLSLSRDLLDALEVPYVPVIGDNEVHSNSEERFDTTFAPRFAELATTFEDFRRAPAAVDNPEWGTTSWLQNVSFRHGGVRFLALDWNSRDPHPLYGELAALHDFPGGTWPWFEAELAGVEPGDAEDVLLFSHHPMAVIPGAMDLDQMDRVAGVTSPIAGRVAAAFAGHFHANYDEAAGAAGFSVHVTDATWDDENTVRVVDVLTDGERFAYAQELVVIPLL
ncbi:MAG: metallophosphoesterase [Alphaproteobacteria bacterium]|nr:metallophosphoesterase [Alphaproteobacteria bacterium]